MSASDPVAIMAAIIYAARLQAYMSTPARKLRVSDEGMDALIRDRAMAASVKDAQKLWDMAQS